VEAHAPGIAHQAARRPLHVRDNRCGEPQRGDQSHGLRQPGHDLHEGHFIDRRDALAALNASLGHLDSDLAADPSLRDQFRAAAIQAFEFTYELALIT